MKLFWVFAMFLFMAWWVRRDMEAYRRFQALTDTADRQRVYWLWIVQSFVILVGASLVTLWLAGGLGDTFPAAFDPAHRLFRPDHPSESGDAALGMATGAALGLTAVIAVQWRRVRNMLKPAQGTAEALLPRNRQEAAIALILSLNAGFSEELFFRLALPLILFQITGSLLAAFALAAIAFGLAHAYQGWKGIAGTMIVGAFITLVYLSSGSLLRVILLHAAIDVVALVVRPAITKAIARRTFATA